MIARRLLAFDTTGGTTLTEDPAAKATADAAAAKATADAAAAAAAATQTPEQKAAAEKAAADKTAADKAAADKATADAAAAAATAKPAAVPDKYDLKLPDKSVLDATALERTTAIARELGLSDTANAQKVLDFVDKEVGAARAAVAADWEPGKGAAWLKQDTDYKAAALADPVLAGGKPEQLAANVDLAKRVLAKFGDAASIAFLEQSGLGSHPGALSLLVKIGKAMGEGSLVLPQTTPPAQRTEADVAKTLYPSMAKA